MSGLVELREYRSVRVRLSDVEVASLREAAGNRLTFGVGSHTGEVELGATSYVGTVVTPTVRVIVRPKISLANVFHLLEAGSTPLSLDDGMFAYEETDELLGALAGFYARQVEIATARGLFQAYRQHDERLVALRGRIDLGAQIRAAGLVSPVACRFDEYTADVTENRVLKAALRRVARLDGVPERTRLLLAGQLLRFDEVGDEEVSHEAVGRVVLTRLNRHYAPALRLAQLILRWASLVDRAGRRQASAFLVDMNKVFEEFLEQRLRRVLSGRLQVLGQLRTWLDVERHVPMRPDLVFRREDRPVYVADAKYKLAPEGVARQSDYYQLLAYCTALRLREGMLVYGHEDGEHPPLEVTARGTGVRLVTHRLPLGGTRAEIDAAVTDLAADVLRRAA